MKNFTLCLINVLILFSCRKKNEGPILPDPPFEICAILPEVVPPAGFKLNRKKSVDFNGKLKEIQLLDSDIWYALGENNVGGYAEIFKTFDGGNSWIDLKLPLRENPGNMFFLNEKEGLISCFGMKGDLLKTVDGGLNWSKLTYPNLEGHMTHIQSDKSNNLYAILSGLNTNTFLIKSINKGVSWEIINDSPDLGFRLITFSFKIFEDRIYVSGKNGRIIVTDLNGKEIERIDTDVPNIWDFEIIDKNNIVMSVSGKIIKTTDGGKKWSEIYNRSARIIDFANTNEGIVILNKSYCATDVYQANDVIAYTKDGGLSWDESPEATNVMISYSDSHLLTNKGYVLLIGKNIFVLDR